jgi:lipoprotein-anchoring transpeptidase ErfK/SrfK
MLVLLLAMVPALALQGSPAGAAASAKPSEQELLVIKKKKAEAARQALVAKRLAAKKAAEAKRLAAQKRVRLIKSASQTRAATAQRRTAAAGRRCDGFLACLFGRKTNRNVRPSSTARLSVGGGSDVATAQVVSWSPGAKYAPGSLIVRTPERALYLVMGDGKARRYKVGVGREGFQWSGNSRIASKQEWPTWRPPQAMIEREAAKGHYLPEEMEGGPENPLGARALYIGGTIYRIHGTNNAASIGGAVSSGCIRMMNTDVIDLYGRVKVGARVYVYQ